MFPTFLVEVLGDENYSRYYRYYGPRLEKAYNTAYKNLDLGAPVVTITKVTWDSTYHHEVFKEIDRITNTQVVV